MHRRLVTYFPSSFVNLFTQWISYIQKGREAEFAQKKREWDKAAHLHKQATELLNELMKDAESEARGF